MGAHRHIVASSVANYWPFSWPQVLRRAVLLVSIIALVAPMLLIVVHVLRGEAGAVRWVSQGRVAVSLW